jgi:hypothetical protein
MELRTASDGSVENERGYHGWIIALMDNTAIIEGCGPTDGNIKDTTSYRTEVCSTLTVLVVYGMIQAVYSWNASNIEHVCDSESALNRVSGTKKRMEFSTNPGPTLTPYSQQEEC